MVNDTYMRCVYTTYGIDRGWVIMTCKTEFDHTYKYSGIDDVSIGWCIKCGSKTFLTCFAMDMARQNLVGKL
jgi:hypothetical protein